MNEIPSKHKYLRKGSWIIFGIILMIGIFVKDTNMTQYSARIIMFLFLAIITTCLVLDQKISVPKYNKYIYEQRQCENLTIQNEREYLNKYSITDDAKEIKCTNIDGYINRKFEGIELKICKNGDELIIISKNYMVDIGKIEIPINNIKSFKRFGDLHSFTNITGGGGGGSSLGGAVVGSVIAGGAGAVIGSRKKIEEVRSEHIIEDKRQTLLEVQGKDRIHYMVFSSGDYDVFLELIPNKEITFIENDKISNSDIYKDIEELSKLKDKGILTEEEFNSKKKELLSKI